MRAAIYTRVSSDPKAVGRSVTEQEADCRRVAEHQGWGVVRVFVDNDRSASKYAKKQRPAYKQLVEFVRAKQCDVLVTWEASRFQRDLEDYARLRELCRKNEVLWSYSGRTYDLSRTDDRFTTALDALLAERESDLTRDRILRAVEANATQGRPHGRLPYGYKREYDRTTGQLVRQVIREDQAEVVREMAHRFLAGETTNAIARDLNARAISAPRGGHWDLSLVRQVLERPTYAGLRVHQTEVIGKANWPAIISEADHYRIVAKFSDPRRKTTNEHAVKYLLSGLMKCKCGSKVKVMPQRGGYKCYICTKNFCVARKIDRVDELIEKLIVARLSRPDALSLFTPSDESEETLDQIAEKRARLETFYDAAAAGELTPRALARIEQTLLSEIEVLEAKVRRYDVPSVVYELAKRPEKVWKTLTLEQKRECLRCLVEITLHPSRRGEHSLDPKTVKVAWRGSAADEPTALPKAAGQ
jgi:site-specific DNA recombinase